MRTPSDNALFALTRAAWRHATPQRWRMSLFYGLAVAGAVVVSLQPIVLAKIINTVQAGNPHAVRDSLSWAAVYGGMIVVFWSLHGPARVIERWLAFDIYEDFVAMLYRAVTEMPLRWHQDHHSGNVINRINKAARALFEFAQQQFVVIQMSVRFIVSLIVLGFYSSWVLAVSLVLAVILTIAIRRFDQEAMVLMNTTNEREHRLNATLYDYIGNIITVLTLRLQGSTRDEVGLRIGAMRPPFKRLVLVNELKWSFVNIVLVVAQAGLVGAYIAVHLMRHEVIVVGSIVAIFQYLLIISDVFYNGANIYSLLVQRHTDLIGVDGLLEDHARLKASPANQQSSTWRTIRVEIPRFTHQESETVVHHLHDVTLDVAAGQKIALIGPSGSGKTTLLTLMRGLYDAPQVRLTIDGHGFESLAPLSGFTTMVPQDCEIFENTILYNLTLGTDVPEQQLWQAMTATTFDGVVANLPEGLSTDIRERGVNLSGGQKQRLALARGLLAARESSLLLLDEPTSSVDLATEKTIFDGLFAWAGTRTIVASVHRLHLLGRFDHIALMEDGRIIEQGGFTDLLARRGAFAKLWQDHLAQSAGDVTL